LRGRTEAAKDYSSDGRLADMELENT
jgi:hypothetical protein